MKRLLLSALCVLGASLSATGKPNILVILTDDVGWGDFQCYNSQSKISAPNVDRLAREGMRFTHAHSPAALCSPTRCSMLTGNYPWRGREAAGTWGFNVPVLHTSGEPVPLPDQTRRGHPQAARLRPATQQQRLPLRAAYPRAGARRHPRLSG